MANTSEQVGGDITEYIKGNDSILTADNYNDIDALVFAELSYAKFENNPAIKDTMTIGNFAGKMAELAGDDDKKEFLLAIKDSERYSECMIVDKMAENTDSQWAALTIQMEKDDTSSVVVAMRGTDGTTLGWTEDFELFYDSDGTKAQQLAADYLKNVDAEHIYMTGHSKGGNDVTSAYIMNNADVRERVCQINNFDGPGVNPEYKNNPDFCEAYGELGDKLTNIYPYNTVIGKLLNDNPGKNVYIDCDTEGHIEIPVLGTHDPFSFQIDENGNFIEKEQSLFSKYVNETLDGVMHSLTNEERQEVVEVITKLGIPAMIADDKKKNPYINDATWWDKMKHGFEIFESCSDEQKAVVRDVIIATVAESKEFWNENKDEIHAEIKKAIKVSYENLIQNIEEGKKALIKKIRSFANGVVDRVDTFFDGLSKFMERHTQDHLWKKWFCSDEVAGTAFFSVNIPKIEQFSKELLEISNETKRIKGNLYSVQGELGLPYIGVNLGKHIRTLGKMEKEIKQYGDTLIEITKTYEKAEKTCVNMKFSES